MTDEKDSARTDELDAAPTRMTSDAGQVRASRASRRPLPIAQATGISAALTPVRSLASGANRIIGERPGARVRRVREMGHDDLVNLWDVHPEARRASIRELGLQSVPVDRIKGTAVEGAAAARRRLPAAQGRVAPDDWRSRWQRILAALDRLEVAAAD